MPTFSSALLSTVFLHRSPTMKDVVPPFQHEANAEEREARREAGLQIWEVELGEPQGPFPGSHPIIRVAAWCYEKNSLSSCCGQD